MSHLTSVLRTAALAAVGEDVGEEAPLADSAATMGTYGHGAFVGVARSPDLVVSGAASDRLLLTRALADDRTALSELARRLAPIIRQRIARVLRRRGSAGQSRFALDDLTQEVFVRLLASDRRALRAWDPARGLSLSSFVGMIAEREASSALGSQRRTPRSDGLELHADLDELHGSLEPGERQQIARDLLVKLYERLHAWLSPRGRELFEMLYLHDEPLDAVATRFGMPASAVYAWRSRLGRRARELLDELV